MITMIGNPNAEMALTVSNVFIFCCVMSYPGNKKEDKKNAIVVIKYIIDVCNDMNPARCLLSGN